MFALTAEDRKEDKDDKVHAVYAKFQCCCFCQIYVLLLLGNTAHLLVVFCVHVHCQYYTLCVVYMCIV